MGLTILIIIYPLFLVLLLFSLNTASLIAQALPEQYRENFKESFSIRKSQHLELK
jgi:hypothetical protein